MSKKSQPTSSATTDKNNKRDNSALIRASESGQTFLLKSLLESDDDANINSKDKYGRSLLILACEQGHEDTVQMLISRRADLNIRSLRDGATALIRNASLGNATINNGLIQASAELNVQDKEGKTALMCAVEFNHVQIALALMKAVGDNVGCGAFFTYFINTSSCNFYIC